MKSKILYNFVKLNIFFVSICFFAQDLDKNKYLKHLDSANNKVSIHPKLANLFLDSIPTPVENHIKGHLAEYYHLKAIVNTHLNHQTEIIYNNILSLKYAEIEKNYKLAGAASLQLFHQLYILKKDTTSYYYHKKAENFFKLDNNREGLMEAMLMHDFGKFSNTNYEKSNELIIPKLKQYQSFKEDSYYYMTALYKVTSNYIHLNDQTSFEKYFEKFERLEADTTISKLNYKEYKIGLYNCMVHFYSEQNNLDLTAFYLEKTKNMRMFMMSSDVEEYFNNNIKYYDKVNDLENKNFYLDSLNSFQAVAIEKTLKNNVSLGKTLLEVSNKLNTETEENILSRNWIIFLATLLLAFIIFVFIRYKSIKKVLKEFTKRTKEYSFLQNNHEKLKVKVIGLEHYIVDLKKEVKSISSMTNIDDQRTKIKELHKEIHHSSSILLVKGEDHLDLINDLNVDFFNQISTQHPELNPSETIICYYLFMGFKTKEIGTFIKASVRSVESKRYRITNKLNLKEKDIKLVDYLDNNFKQTLSKV